MNMTFNLGAAERKTEKGKTHIPSKIQADTLFNFVNSLDYLIGPLQKKMLAPRYCEEDLRYLKLSKLKKIAFPMKCFCDINLHRLEEHLAWYGYYGLAFTKEWGMKQGIQPIQYVNPDSALIKDFSNAFLNAMKIKVSSQTKYEKILKSNLLHQLMYFKPYSGKFESRNPNGSKRKRQKCFTDECEWRYVPNVSGSGYSQIYYNEKIFKDGNLAEISNSMADKSEFALHFDYDDLKYIIVKSVDDFEKITTAIIDMKLSKEEETLLISKILIWELSGGDF